MALVKEMYTANRVNLIYQLLKNEAENGAPKEYDIKVDELRVVSRNNDPERFFSHEEFVLPETKNITINIYDNKSHRCTRYTLLLKEEPHSSHELSGIEQSIKNKIDEAKNQWDHDQLKKENESLKEELEEIEEYAEKLQKHITMLEAEKQKSSSKITDTIIGLAGVYLTKNPNVLSGLPLIGEFMGGQETTDSATPGNVDDTESTQNSKVSFSKKQPTYTGTIGEEDVERLHDALIPLFPEVHLEKVSTIIRYMYHNNHLVDQIAGMLAESAKQKNAA